MNRDELDMILKENNCIISPQFAEALCGYVQGAGMEIKAVYDFDLCLHILQERDGMSEEDAREYMDHDELQYEPSSDNRLCYGRFLKPEVNHGP